MIEYTLKVTPEETNLLFTGLLELPAKHSYNLITKLRQQVKDRIPPPIPETPPAEG